MSQTGNLCICRKRKGNFRNGCAILGLEKKHLAILIDLHPHLGLFFHGVIQGLVLPGQGIAGHFPNLCPFEHRDDDI